ncbi:MAG: homoserine dehydrogenase, partial [Micavibrio sp.]
MSSTALRIGIAGLGTVGAALAGLLREHGDLVSRRAGRPIQITAVSARDRGKDRGVDLSLYAWEDDPLAIASRDDVDLVVELIGGADGVAKQLVETALENGKHV